MHTVLLSAMVVILFALVTLLAAARDSNFILKDHSSSVKPAIAVCIVGQASRLIEQTHPLKHLVSPNPDYNFHFFYSFQKSSTSSYLSFTSFDPRFKWKSPMVSNPWYANLTSSGLFAKLKFTTHQFSNAHLGNVIEFLPKSRHEWVTQHNLTIISSASNKALLLDGNIWKDVPSKYEVNVLNM